MNLNPIICERQFFIWKLEYWWVFIDKPEFRPKGRTKIRGNWYWRN